ncbi:MAG: rRNA small subunit methyltransferase B, partial [Acidobacteria bacterium]|nr:rRNA small subunit methyltransferase B [Acidobacteriota bacterium]
MSDNQQRGPRGSAGEGRNNQRRGGQDRPGQGREDQGKGGQSGDGRRDAAGRERNRNTGPRSFSAQAPSQRSRMADPARLVAFEVLRAVAADDAYANLVLPARIRHHRLDRRDAGFATELAYGALRAQGTYDAILARCVDRPLNQLDPALLDALRIGAHQLLAMRVPVHAALNQTVGLVRAVVGAGPSSLANAVLRKVSAKDLPQWLDELAPEGTESTKAAAIRRSHPEWIVRAFRQSLVAHGRPVSEIDALLEADNTAPVVNLVALPGIGTLNEALEAGFTAGPLAPNSALSSGGDPGRLDSVRSGSVRVQDAGSQLVARALAAAPRGQKSLDAAAAAGGGQGERWLDLCAGPGGKAAL